jgi:hypothetical protein
VAAGSLRYAALIAFAVAGAAMGAAAAPSAFDLAGHYSYSFRNGNVSGEQYRSTDTLDIVARDRTHAVFDIQLNFYNGHECSLGGEAVLEGRALVYREMTPLIEGEPPCVLRLWRDRGRMRWDDGDNSCKAYCGARGSFMDGGMAWSTRRPIPRATRARFLRPDRQNPG